MGRTPGSKNKAKTKLTVVDGEGEKTTPGAGHNQLSDEDQQRLFFQHKGSYEAALAKKKKADADFKNACKLAKSEIGDGAVKMIKDAILLDSEEGQAEIEAEIERKRTVARWMNVPLGSQMDMFSESADERAYKAGKTSGIAGETLKNPYGADLVQHERYATGWHDGQKVNLDKIKAPAEADDEREKDLRPPFMQQGDEALAGVPGTSFK